MGRRRTSGTTIGSTTSGSTFRSTSRTSTSTSCTSWFDFSAAQASPRHTTRGRLRVSRLPVPLLFPLLEVLKVVAVGVAILLLLQHVPPVAESVVVPAVAASPLLLRQQRYHQQHRIPRTQRQVPYGNRRSNNQRRREETHDLQPKFWIPSRSLPEQEKGDGSVVSDLEEDVPILWVPQSRRHQKEEGERLDLVTRIAPPPPHTHPQEEEEDDFSHVLGDASRENAHVVFQELKNKTIREKSKSTTTATTTTTIASSIRKRLRTLQDNVIFGGATTTTTTTTTSSSTSGSSTNSNTNNPEQRYNLPTHRESFYYNVTTGIEYNVSQTIDDDSQVMENNSSNINATTGVDVSTVIYTDSERVENQTNANTPTSLYTAANATALNNTAYPSNESDDFVFQFRPIRIRAFLSEIDGGGMFLRDVEHRILLQDIVRPALLSWSAALRVNPVVGNLTVDAHQLADDGTTCGPGRDSGLPSAAVPKSHLTRGVANTDLILYLNLGFTDDESIDSGTNGSDSSLNGNQTSTIGKNSSFNMGMDNNRQEDMVNDDFPVESSPNSVNLGVQTNTSISNNYNYNSSSNNNSNAQDVGNNSKRNNNTNKNNNMFPMKKRPTCTGAYLAASAICSTDQYDRPTAAILHICIGPDFFNVSSLRRNVVTVRHELGHVLGFNSWSLAHFRRLDGTPITPRNNETGEIPLTEVECTGPLSSRTYANVTLPSPEILQFRTVRGGVRVAEVVTPSVVQVVRNHFDCHELIGAELESGESLPLSTDPLETACIGDHWERRLFKSDLMNAVVEDLEFNPRISTLNLAYFADSGWYQVDLSRASPAAGWGRALGCDFVEQQCVNSDGQVPLSFQDSFCSESPTLDTNGFANDINGCTQDMTKKAACSMEHYDGPLPVEYQYFNSTFGANVGGRDPYMDYCPVYSGFTNGLCTDPENEALIRVDVMERFGERNSRCIPGLMSTRRTALCLRIACAVEDRSFHVQVDGMWRPCSSKGQVLEAANGDRVYCPDPIRVCPTFYCLRDCLGTDLICNYTQGKCVCSNDTTCAESDEDEESFYYDPWTNSTTSLPDEDSPLSDYYVPTSRVLMDESPRFSVADWVFVCTAVGLVVVLGLLFYTYYRRKRRAQAEAAATASLENGGSDGAIRNAEGEFHNPNKHKMLATVVVDLRMNDPNLRDDALGNDRASETDLSLTDTDGGGTYVTDLSIAEFNDRGSIMGDDSSTRDEYFDPLAAPCVVRRRNVHT